VVLVSTKRCRLKCRFNASEHLQVLLPSIDDSDDATHKMAAVAHATVQLINYKSATPYHRLNSLAPLYMNEQSTARFLPFLIYELSLMSSPCCLCVHPS
jgi:hypothetical protein